MNLETVCCHGGSVTYFTGENDTFEKFGQLDVEVLV